MTLTKKKMVSEIGRRTRLRNYDVQRVIESLIQVWMEELTSGGRIEIQNFLVLELRQIDRGERRELSGNGSAPRYIQRVTLRVSKKLKERLNHFDSS
jgi:nucleoid DNA-binding protein